MRACEPLEREDIITVSLVVGNDWGDPDFGVSLLDVCDRVRVFFLQGSTAPMAPWVLHPRVAWTSGALGGTASAFLHPAALQGYHIIMSPGCQYAADYCYSMVQKVERYGRKAIVGTKGGFRMWPQGFRLLPADEPLARDLPVHELDPRSIAYHAGTIHIPREAFGPGGSYLSQSLGDWAQGAEVPLVSVKRSRSWVTVREENFQSPGDPGYRVPVRDNSTPWRLFGAPGTKE